MSFKKTILPILLSTIWISISEFVRNELIVKKYWTEHFNALNLVFPSEPLNGAMWGVWSMMLAVAIFLMAKKFSLIQTTLISWFMAFAMMWVVIGNLGVLPYGILYAAIPLSLLEAFIASYIIKKFSSAG